MTRAGFPHSDTPGSQLGCQLPRAYRRLPRPSSALDAKASTMRPSQLAKKPNTTNYKDARVHYPDLKQQPHTTPTHPTRGRPERPGPSHPPPTPHKDKTGGSDASDTQQCAAPPHTTGQHKPLTDHARDIDDSTIRTPPSPPHSPHKQRGRPDGQARVGECVLLRKEVIQPHLPVRLPCYDFVPIASPTFDGSPHKG